MEDNYLEGLSDNKPDDFLEEFTGDIEEPKELTERTGLPQEKITTLLRISREPLSLETPLKDEEDGQLIDLIEDKTSLSPLDVVIQTDLQKQIKKALEGLNYKEAEIIKRRFGIEDGIPRTLEEIGNEFKLTREQIRQIEIRVLRKLRHPKRSKWLRSFMERGP